MQESTVARKLLDDLRKGVKGREIKSAVFEVGELAPVIADELEKALKELADFPFSVEEKSAKVKCCCGYEGMPEILDSDNDSIIFACPKCSNVPEIVEGGGIKIMQVELKEN